jgi:hypothetical protein
MDLILSVYVISSAISQNVITEPIFTFCYTQMLRSKALEGSLCSLTL